RGWGVTDGDGTLAAAAIAFPDTVPCPADGDCTNRGAILSDGRPSPADGEALSLPRVGMTVTTSGNRGLVWGGVLAETQAEALASAGAILDGSGSAEDVALPTTTGKDWPTAFHTASAIGDGVLVVGGVRMDCIGAQGCDLGAKVGVSTWYPLSPIRHIDLGAATPSVTTVAIPEYSVSALHSATVVTLDDVTGVLVLGGTGEPAQENDGGAEPDEVIGATLEGRDQSVFVIPDGSGFVATGFSGRIPARLAVGRWGHAAAAISYDRVLVTGGFVLEGGFLRTLFAPEVLNLAEPPKGAGQCE
ncbi:MAG: hypothetical protein KC416_16385, partial [Myxococcales bacterium]|nr:hypothetical protein [Myxococcales bacterium]